MGRWLEEIVAVFPNPPPSPRSELFSSLNPLNSEVPGPVGKSWGTLGNASNSSAASKNEEEPGVEGVRGIDGRAFKPVDK